MPSSPLVLVVDDNHINQLIVAEMLTLFGVDFLIASGGADSIEKCHTRHPTLVLMDIWMPGMTGLDAATIIRSNWNDPLPVMIAMSADVTGENRALCSKAGFDGFLAKPIEIAVMRNLLDQHLGLQLEVHG